MSEATHLIQGRAAAIRIENLDTDQIMPKQFLRGIDKSGLAQGLLTERRLFQILTLQAAERLDYNRSIAAAKPGE